MYNIFPLILIFASLAVIIFVIARRYSDLSNLEIQKMTTEREAKFKEEIIVNRLKRSFTSFFSKIVQICRPVYQGARKFLLALYNNLHEAKEKYKISADIANNDDQKMEKLFNEVDELVENGNLDLGEKKLINIIELDNQNIEAFRGLGQIYFEQKKYKEAIQTFEHVIKLGEEDEDYFDLALVLKATNDLGKALENIQKALDLNPNNPRYLDALLEISIIEKEKILALDAYKKLKEVNPQNAKLEQFKEQIDEL